MPGVKPPVHPLHMSPFALLSAKKIVTWEKIYKQGGGALQKSFLKFCYSLPRSRF